MSAPLETVTESWGADAPDWVIRLAEECAASSQRQVAGRLDRSGALVNQVLKNKYNGDLAAVEDCVRGVFMNGTIECPALGSIPSNECHDWRKKSRQFGNANMLRVRMFRACNGFVAQIAVRDSLFESSMITERHEQLGTYAVQDHELVVIQ